MAVNRFGAALGMFFVRTGLVARIVCRGRPRPPLSWSAAAVLVLTAGVWVAHSVAGSGVQLVDDAEIRRTDPGKSLLAEWTEAIRAVPPAKVP